MDSEASWFESSETVASFLASTPLLSESWRLSILANAAASPPCGFVSDQIGDVGYFAFSCEQEYYWRCRDLVALMDTGDAGQALFSPLTKNYSHPKPNDINGSDEEEAVMVHAGMLNLFLSMRNSTQAFREQMLALIEKSKSIIITGHSTGGTIATLCALWLLSNAQSISSTLSVLCITFGSPLLGNESLSRAILRERWGGNFCHVVSKYDIVPRLSFAPLELCTTQLHFLRQHWYGFGNLGVQLQDEEKAELFQVTSACLQASVQAGEDTASSLYWPFGSYLFCSQEGAICLENAASVIKMMHLTFVTSNPNCCIEDHLKYGEYIGKVSSQFLNKRNLVQEELPESSCEAGVALALQSSGISGQEPAAAPAKECLKIARRLGRTPSLKAANLAIRLSKITPYRAQIEWYKASCDKSDEQLGYYDSFKQAGSKRNHKVNMNRHKLAAFWNGIIDMLDNNELPHDFHKRAKWVNASQFYKTLVEPLDIADYYRSGMHNEKDHYLKHGRERRFEIFDRWWREKRANEEESSRKRSKYAGLTQDSCFWAKVEEAKEWLVNVRSESDVRKLSLLWENISNFESYADRLVKNKEISVDVVAKNSSYVKWVEELREFRSQAHHTHPLFPSFRYEN